MRYLLTFVAVIALSVSNIYSAVPETTDTVKLGAGYVSQAYYSMKSGIAKTTALADWDIAFLNGQNAAIHINAAKGNELYWVKNSSWNSFDKAADADTTGFWADSLHEKWIPHYNSEETWIIGAFNRGMNGFETEGDFGWGDYDFLTHKTEGKGIFLLKMADKEFKKIIIDTLSSGKYYFRIANLDGSDLIADSVVKADFPGKNFGYYSISERKVLDPEPISAGWDLLFTKYVGLYNMGETSMPYGFTGVKSNMDVLVAEKSDDPFSSLHEPSDDDYSENITTIGYDWKEFSFSSGYTITEDLSYYVKPSTGDVWKIQFTGFDGSETGNVYFAKMIIVNVGVDEETGSTVSVYPNIIDRGSDFDIVVDNRENSSVNISIIDMQGRTIRNIENPDFSGFRSYRQGSTEIAPGMYFINVEINGKQTVSKFIVR